MHVFVRSVSLFWLTVPIPPRQQRDVDGLIRSDPLPRETMYFL